MIEIQCPHCKEGIELQREGFGLFDCPVCKLEFEWKGSFFVRPSIVTIILLIILLFSTIVSCGLYYELVNQDSVIGSIFTSYAFGFSIICSIILSIITIIRYMIELNTYHSK